MKRRKTGFHKWKLNLSKKPRSVSDFEEVMDIKVQRIRKKGS